MGRLSLSCCEALDNAGLILSVSMGSGMGIMREGVRVCGDSVADDGPAAISSFESSSRNLEPCRLGVDTWRPESASIGSALDSRDALASRRTGDVGRYCCCEDDIVRA